MKTRRQLLAENLVQQQQLQAAGGETRKNLKARNANLTNEIKQLQDAIKILNNKNTNLQEQVADLTTKLNNALSTATEPA